MRTLPLVLGVVLLNDALLVLLLDVAVPAWAVVLAASLVLTGAVFAVVEMGAESDGPPSRRKLQREVEALRERVDRLESE